MPKSILSVFSRRAVVALGIIFTTFAASAATIAWSGNLTPEFKTDVSLKTFFGRGSGESLQMQFRGNGFVVVQPYEEVYTAAGK